MDKWFLSPGNTNGRGKIDSLSNHICILKYRLYFDTVNISEYNYRHRHLS
jgi:hypothetical protein